MAAGRASCYADTLRINAQARRIRAKVAHGGLDVVHGRGKWSCRRQTIVDGGGYVAALCEANALCQIPFARPGAEAAAMDTNYNRMRLPRVARAHDVHHLLRVGGA